MLVVEADGQVQSALARTLEEDGCRVLPACDCRAAVTLVAALDLPVDLVITDVSVPYLEGHSLLEELARLHHYPAVLLVSSHPAPITRRGVPAPLGPTQFTPAALRAAVHRLLGLERPGADISGDRVG